MATMEGGFDATDKKLYHILLSLRAHGWTRNLPQENYVTNKSEIGSLLGLYCGQT